SVRQRLDLSPLGQASEGLRLDLADALAREAEDPADLLQRFRVRVPVHAVAELDDLAFTVGQRLDRLTYRFLAEADVKLLRRLGVIAGEQFAEAGIPFAADGLVEARHSTGRRADLPHVLQRKLRSRRDLLV